MKFEGNFLGASAKYLVGSGASTNFVNASLVRKLNLKCRSVPTAVIELPDKSTLPIQGQVTITVRIQDYKESLVLLNFLVLDFLVAEFGPEYDVILGDVWLTSQIASLCFDPTNPYCVFWKGSKTLKLKVKPASNGFVSGFKSDA